MKTTVTTHSGSRYVIDDFAMTWERREAGEGSIYVRTKGGTLLSVPEIEVGKRMIMLGPPLDPDATIRYISTSPVTTVSFEQ